MIVLQDGVGCKIHIQNIQIFGILIMRVPGWTCQE